jgi:hypothetical protein
MQTANLLGTHGLGMQYAFEFGTYIAINREKLVKRFMASNAQFLLFLDGDTVFQAQDVLALLAADVDVVSGLYRYRQRVPPGMAEHSFRDAEGKAVRIDLAAELQECALVPTGMLLIRRSVFERLYTKHRFVFDQGFRAPRDEIADLFETEDEIAESFEGEDTHFCRIWREMGGQIFVKPSVRLGHLGEHEYRITPDARNFENDPRFMHDTPEAQAWEAAERAAGRW